MNKLILQHSILTTTIAIYILLCGLLLYYNFFESEPKPIEYGRYAIEGTIVDIIQYTNGNRYMIIEDNSGDRIKIEQCPPIGFNFTNEYRAELSHVVGTAIIGDQVRVEYIYLDVGYGGEEGYYTVAFEFIKG